MTYRRFSVGCDLRLLMSERYASELRPEYRLVQDENPPLGTKLLLLCPTGVAVIGHFEEGLGYLAWAPLPKLTAEQKERLR